MIQLLAFVSAVVYHLRMTVTHWNVCGHKKRMWDGLFGMWVSYKLDSHGISSVAESDSGVLKLAMLWALIRNLFSGKGYIYIYIHTHTCTHMYNEQYRPWN
jgi:hypothetical protein